MYLNKRGRLLCEMFLAQMRNGHITSVKVRQFHFGEIEGLYRRVE
mgnify:CR=1 FL=1